MAKACTNCGYPGTYILRTPLSKKIRMNLRDCYELGTLVELKCPKCSSILESNEEWTGHIDCPD